MKRLPLRSRRPLRFKKGISGKAFVTMPPLIRVFAIVVSSFLCAFKTSAADDLTLWYRQPAKEWTEALPVGNGRLGAMVFGGPEHERLQLNENTLWSGGPYDPNNPEALAALPEARRLIFAGKYK
jgi:hypothetical protein